MTTGDPVRLEREGPLAIITLARPEAGNAIDLDVCEAFQAAAQSCAEDRDVRALLLRAEGKAFCVGGDLNAFQAAGEGRPALMAAMAERFHAAQATLMSLDAPVVAAVQGPVAGAGLGLAMAADLVLAAASASFTVAYTAIGLSADGGSTYLLPRLIGLRRTQELMFTNRRLGAEEARAWGLVTAVVDDAALATEAEALARRLAAGPTAAHGVIKRLLSSTYARDFQGQTDEEGREIARLAGGRDAAEGIAAFQGKRAPAFLGQG